MRNKRALVGVVVAIALVAVAGSAAPADSATANVLPRPFATGDILAANPTGTLNWYAADGTFVAELSTGLTSIQAVAASPDGQVWAVDRTRPMTLSRIDATGAVTTTSPVGGTLTPTSFTFDAAGNAYVGDYEIFGYVSKFSSSGTYLGHVINHESDYIDLAADQCTMYLQRPGWSFSATERWNACTGTFIDVFYNPHADAENPPEAHGLRVLPDGSVLIYIVGDGTARVDASGNLVRTYSFPECSLGAPQTLSPDGTSFYAGCAGHGVYEVDVATGANLRTLDILSPVTVMGGYRASVGAALPDDTTPPTIDVTTPAEGGVYTLGQAVEADYGCADETLLDSCTGTVADGAPIDTSSVGTKTFTVDASDAAGNAASRTVTYDVVLPSLGITDATVDEGSSAELVVSLSAPTTVQVRVRYATANGTARSGADFVRASGTLTFAPGETTQTVTVASTSDALFELDETFSVNLTSPTNATLGDAQGVVTITNDDPMPTISIGDASVVEGAAGTTTQLAFPVTLSAPSGLTSRAAYATADGTAVAPSDYGARRSSVSIRAGSTTGTIIVTIKGDAVLEPHETFAVVLSTPTNVTIDDGEATGTIVNDD